MQEQGGRDFKQKGGRRKYSEENGEETEEKKVEGYLSISNWSVLLYKIV